jgi:hypothetical protein
LSELGDRIRIEGASLRRFLVGQFVDVVAEMADRLAALEHVPAELGSDEGDGTVRALHGLLNTEDRAEWKRIILGCESPRDLVYLFRLWVVEDRAQRKMLDERPRAKTECPQCGLTGTVAILTIGETFTLYNCTGGHRWWHPVSA